MSWPVSRGCPCVYTTPCHPDCTCVKPFMSRGCGRCATYGSPEQQREMAEYLAKKIDHQPLNEFPFKEFLSRIGND